MTHVCQDIPVERLKPNPHNTRTHSRQQKRALAKIIGKLGFGAPVITDENLVLLAGHCRLEAAKLIGLKKIPTIVWTGLSEAKKRAVLLADNKLGEQAGWDRKLLAIELPEVLELLNTESLDFEVTGFQIAEMDAILQDFEETPADPADDIDSAWMTGPRVTWPGDTWILDEHRLRCGDATSGENFGKLMGSERARMMSSDPPYNVRIRNVVGRGRRRHREFAMASGEMSDLEFTGFLATVLGLAADYSLQNALHYVFMDWRHLPQLFAAGQDVYAEMLNLIVWDKTNAGQGGLYRSQHELIGVYRVGDEPHINNVELGKHGRNRTNVWRYAGQNTFGKDRLDALRAHPTVKPVALVADAIKDCTKRDDIVLDPFCGSGTTILAAEKVGRRARCLEIDCTYVDLAVRRWQSATKKDAVHAVTGRVFEEVAEERSDEGKTHPADQGSRGRAQL